MPAFQLNSKIQVLESPRINPGTCVVCGSSRTDDRQYIDLGLTIEWYGVVYFCTFCFTEAANQLGCLTKEQSEKLENELDSAKKLIIDFTVKEQSLDGAINSLRSTGLFSDSEFIGAHVPNDTNPITQPSLIDEITNGNKQSIERTSNLSKQSSSEQRSNELSSSTSDDFEDLI